MIFARIHTQTINVTDYPIVCGGCRQRHSGTGSQITRRTSSLLGILTMSDRIVCEARCAGCGAAYRKTLSVAELPSQAAALAASPLAGDYTGIGGLAAILSLGFAFTGPPGLLLGGLSLAINRGNTKLIKKTHGALTVSALITIVIVVKALV